MILEVKNLCKNFNENKNNYLILNNLSFSIQKGEIVSIYGASGSGKTTLLNIISGLIEFDSGTIKFNNKLLNERNDFHRLRKNHLGIVFQENNLINEFNIVENIMLPQMISGKSKELAYKNSKEILKKFNLIHIEKKYPNLLSGGEKQRVSILRAVINKPKLILADEPTGSIDEYNKELIFNLFKEIAKEFNTSLLIATHDNNVSKISNNILNLSRGKINYYEQ
tara:strand:- start:363 stop:1034 length:672 start_codon:yes stop_codon:yes gene_type:complete